MDIWVLLWFFLTLSMVVFTVWTLSILIRQKRAWKLYAQKRKLRYTSKGMMASPSMTGVMGEYKVSLFTGEHASADQRNMRKLTAIEVALNTRMPVNGGIANGGMISIIKAMGWRQEFMPDYEGWKKEYVVSTDNKYVVDTYLTPDRLKVLCELMAIKNAWVVLVFKGDAMLLRLDTPDPLAAAKNIDVFVKQMIAAATVLELNEGEHRILKTQATQEPVKQAALDVNEDALLTAGLELEEVEVAAEAEAEVDDSATASEDDAKAQTPDQ